MRRPIIHLKNYLPSEMSELVKTWKLPPYRGDQILEWLYQKKISCADEMTNLPKGLREQINNEAIIVSLELAEKLTSPRDGTEKFLFKTEDGELIECTVMKHDYGNTVCVSSQIGCNMACLFCASTKGGLVRNLSSGEMLDQVILAEKHLEKTMRINNIVVMGMGEPLQNLYNLLRFLRTSQHPQGLGISFRNITVSTAGIPPRIIDLADEKLPLTLAVSLHAADNHTRNKLMPINKNYPLEKVMEACIYYLEKTQRRITFEYVLMADINDSPQQAKELAELIKKMLCHVNLIPANPIKEANIKKPSLDKVKEFANILEQHGVSVSIRKEKGTDIEGACGQLRRRYSQPSS